MFFQQFEGHILRLLNDFFENLLFALFIFGIFSYNFYNVFLIHFLNIQTTNLDFI